jgi:plasmid maintenance system antidote protein VapI
METSNPTQKRFRSAYINLNITYAELTRMLAERLGVTERTVANYRAGRTSTTPEQDQIIAEFFDHLREMYMLQQPA